MDAELAILHAQLDQNIFTGPKMGYTLAESAYKSWHSPAQPITQVMTRPLGLFPFFMDRTPYSDTYRLPPIGAPTDPKRIFGAQNPYD